MYSEAVEDVLALMCSTHARAACAFQGRHPLEIIASTEAASCNIQHDAGMQQLVCRCNSQQHKAQVLIVQLA